MKIMNYLKSIIIITTSILISCLIITILNYYNFLESNTIKYLKLLSIVLSMIIGSFYLGKRSTNKGYLEGIKIGLIETIILFILNIFIFKNKPCFDNFIYYLIIIISSILGSIIGINKKSKS